MRHTFTHQAFCVSPSFFAPKRQHGEINELLHDQRRAGQLVQATPNQELRGSRWRKALSSVSVRKTLANGLLTPFWLESQNLLFLLFLSGSFFTACPPAKVVFGFLSDASPQSLARDHRKRFIRHASILIQMIETAINMLGPDIETLSEIMTGLGRKHVSYGVTPDMFPILGQCLIDTLAECLNDESPGSFRSESRDAWEEVYSELSGDIILAYSKENRRQSANL